MYLSTYNNNIITIIYTDTHTNSRRTGKENKCTLSLSALNADLISDLRRLICREIFYFLTHKQKFYVFNSWKIFITLTINF